MATSTTKSLHPPRREKSERKLRVSPTLVEAETRAVVLAQPHRNGSMDQRRRWAVGRLILDGKVTARGIDPDALERAADRYHQLCALERWLLDSRRPYALCGVGRRKEPTPEERKEIEKQAGDVRRVLRDAGPNVAKAVHVACVDLHPDFDERVLNQWIVLALPQGLAALVRHWGMET